MGAGKSTFGRALARDLGREFHDLDAYIEARFRKKVADIFDERGEEGFRVMERNMLHEVAEFDDAVIAVGGGTPCFFDNMEYMNSRAETIYLHADTPTLIAHIHMGKQKRPLIDGMDDDELREFIEKSMAEREKFYCMARHRVEVEVVTEQRQIDKMTDKIKRLICVSGK